MSEAIWIELIKVLPAFLWVIFGFIVLAVAKRIFTAQAPRMTKVETPWVTVELAQQAIEQAAVRGPVPPPAERDWTQLYPLPTQQVPAGIGPISGAGGFSVGDDVGGNLSTGDVSPQSPTVADLEESDIEDETDEPFQTEPTAEPKPELPATPPADGPADDALANGGKKNDDGPPATVTAPNQQVPNIPPTYPVMASPPGGGNLYYGAPIPQGQNGPFRLAPLPAYGQAPPYPSAQSDTRSLRAATRLALAANELQGGAILWVDDHHEWNEPLIRLFRTAGITIEPVASTDEALRALQNRSFDLVVTDMRREMEPEGDTAGTRLLDRMIAAGIPTPAVFFSDHPNAHTALHPRAVTATNSPEKLVDTVVDIVGTRRSQQASNAGTSWLSRLKG